MSTGTTKFPARNDSRILFSARDTAAALFMSPIVEAASRRRDCKTSIVAQGLAVDILKNVVTDGVPLTVVADTSEVDELSLAADRLLEAVRPEAVVTGLSAPGRIGIDEILVRQAMLANVPSISTVQDFWGECNFLPGAKPQRLFVQDAYAKRQTEARHGIPCVVVGSTRHDWYSRLIPLAIRQDFRGSIDAGSRKVVLFLGQSLHRVRGYHDHLAFLGRRLAEGGGEAIHYYRPHPTETAEEVGMSMRFLNADSSLFILAPDVPLENILCGSDAAISMFSNCLYDAAYLNRVSTAPIITPVSAILSTDFHAALKNDIGIDVDELPYETTGIAVIVRPSNRFALDDIPNQDELSRVWMNAHMTLEKPGAASSAILDYLLA